jgi:hypothetical protein
MRASLKLLVFGTIVAAAPAGAVEPAAAVDLFGQVCLDHATSPQAARDAAAALGFEKQAMLPGIGGGAPLEPYLKSPWELLIRDAKSGRFSCILLFPLDDGAANAAVAEAVGALPGLSVKSSKGGEQAWRAKWMRSAAPKGSEVVLTIDSDTGSRVAILTLESKSAK